VHPPSIRQAQSKAAPRTLDQERAGERRRRALAIATVLAAALGIAALVLGSDVRSSLASAVGDADRSLILSPSVLAALRGF
jgi:ferric-dicitrate binding protein FerR (iron transport regulator)